MPPADKKRIVFAEGEEERVLRAVQVIVDEKIATPILIGRPAVVQFSHREIRFTYQARDGFRDYQSRI